MIKIGTNSQSIEHHHHHIHHLGNGACVDNTPFMTPAQSVENFYNVNDDMLVEDLDTADEALSVAGTEYSEAPSVARSYTISQHSNQVGYLSFFFSIRAVRKWRYWGANCAPQFLVVKE